MEVLLEARNLSKNYGGFLAVNDISLTVKKGEVLGFLGPNGAGKTTTMKMLTGFLAPTSGHAKICGQAVTTGDYISRKKVGYLPEGAPLYGEMTVESFLDFVANTHGFKDGEAKTRVSESALAVHLDHVMSQRIETLSKGFKRRVGLAAAILHAPDVLILDEPTDGLDPNQKHDVRRLIRAMAADRAIIISTHILEEVEALCSRAIIIHEGTIVADNIPAELKAQSRYAGSVSMLVPAGDTAEIAAELRTLADVKDVEVHHEEAGGRITVIPRGQGDLAASIASIANTKGWEISQYAVDAGRLDDVFRALTIGGGAS